MFCIGPTKFRNASRKLGQSVARLISHSAWALRSSGIVKVAASAKTNPGSAAPGGSTSDSTGPCRVVRMLTSTGAPPRTRIVSRRDGRAPFRGQIAAGVGRIDPLDKEILDIGFGCGQTPGDPLIVAD